MSAYEIRLLLHIYAAKEVIPFPKTQLLDDTLGKLFIGGLISEKKRENEESFSEATIKLKVGGITEHTAAEGDGPVNALDNALRKALEKFYPNLKKMHLTDYKVRVLEGKEGTMAKVRVYIESANKEQIWGTVGVSENIIEASWQALVDSINYHLIKDKDTKKKKK